MVGAERQQLRQIGEWLCRRWRFVRLRQAKMVDYQSRIRVPRRQLPGLVETSAAGDIYRQLMLCRRSQNAIDRRGRPGRSTRCRARKY